MRPNARANRRWRLTLRRFGALVAAASVVAGILLAGVVVVSLALARGCGTSSAPDVPMSASRLAATALAGHPVASASAGPDLVFVSLRGWRSGDRSGIEVLRRHRGGLRSTAVISMRSQPAGLATSPNGRLLLAALDEGVAVLDVARAATGDPSALLGTVPTGRGAGTAQVAVAGRYVFTADETAGRVTVLDLPRLEAGDFGPGAQVAAVEVDMAPAGLSGSPDGRYMYVVSQVERPVVSLAPSDFLYSLMTSVGVPRRSGILGVIDIGRIERNAASAIIARVPAGCGPVRVAASPDGKTVWVTARRSNELLAFRADQVLAGRAVEPVARIPVAAGPQGLRLAGDGRFALVAGSDRGAEAGAAQALDVVDTAAALAGRPSLRSVVTAGGMPHEVDLSPDGLTAYVTNAGTSTLSTVDLAALLGA